jgi:type VI secretion system protein ImpH
MRNPSNTLSPSPEASRVRGKILAPDAAERARALAAYLDQVAAAPHQYDFFQLLRRVEALTPHLPPLGQAPRPADEPLRLAQDVSLAFAAAPLGGLTQPGSRGHAGAPRLSQHFFGFLGPNGPLPLHLTEFARERLLHHGDAAFSHLLDMLLHRFLLLFYRAWAQGRPANSLDRPDNDRFAFYVGSLLGVGGDACHRRDALSDHARLHFAGLLNMQTRPAAVLEAIAAAVLRVPVRVEPFCGHWMKLEHDERTVLSGAAGASSTYRRSRPGLWSTSAAGLGRGAVLGARVWDRQHKFRLAIGPLTLSQYEALLPGGAALITLVALVRQHLNREFAWDAKLALRASEVPTVRLGTYGRLGYSAWLAHAARRDDAADLALDADTRVPL